MKGKLNINYILKIQLKLYFYNILQYCKCSNLSINCKKIQKIYF